MTDEHRRDPALLGEPHEPVRAVAHLRDRARRTAERRDRDTVWIESIASTSGPTSRHVRERPPAATSPRRRAAPARARRAGRRAAAPASTDSSAHTSRQRAPARRHRAERLEQQRALAHARLAAEQRDRAGDEPAAEHPVELGHARRAAAGRRADRRRPGPWRCRSHRLWHPGRQCRPRPASAARPRRPTRRNRGSGPATWRSQPAGLALVTNVRSGHGQTVHAASDKMVIP